MRRGFYLKLAAENIKKNGKTYLPYILTCIVTVAMYYIVRSLSLNPGLKEMAGADYLNYTMFLGSRVVAFFAFIFLFYTNSFLLKRRKKEFGVFNILGMEKRHLSRVVGLESLYVTLISLSAGIGLGIALDKAMYLMIGRILGGNVALGFFISVKAVWETGMIFAALFLLICLHSVMRVRAAEPVELLRGGNVGEREPKTKLLCAVIGLAAVGGGYYIAVTTENPIASLLLFFVAVILVIAGTYLLFTAGSIALLKALRRNKRYYYRTRHFVSVSGLLYRMKQNAVGLANICVLSTMVLVTVSSTTSMMVGMESILKVRYPADFMIYFTDISEEQSEEGIRAIRALREEKGLSATAETDYTYLAFSTVRDGDTFLVERDFVMAVLNNINNLFFVPLSVYNEAMGENLTLRDGEVLIYSDRQEFGYPVMKLFEKEYAVAGKLDRFVGNGNFASNMATTQYIVVTENDFGEINERQREVLGDIAGRVRRAYGFDTDAGEKEQEDFYNALIGLGVREGISATMESRAEARVSFVGMYGGFFFIGSFLGVLFVMATVLIIYYKQISEGYDDRERFEIMQKVGMSREEVKAAGHSQVLTVFFLPLIVAGIHVIAAFPMVSRVLTLFNLTDTGLHAACMAVCFSVFAGMYVLIYGLTARTYYRIVQSGRGAVHGS